MPLPQIEALLARTLDEGLIRVFLYNKGNPYQTNFCINTQNVDHQKWGRTTFAEIPSLLAVNKL